MSYCVELRENQNLTFVKNPINHIRIALFKDELIKINTSHYFVCNKFAQLCQFISTLLECSLTFKTSIDNVPGTKLPNGTWTGILGLLAEEKADTVLTPYSYREDRDSIVHFGLYFPSKRLVGILTCPTFKPDNLIRIFQIFHINVWITILLLYILVNLVEINPKYFTWNQFTLNALEKFRLLVGQAGCIRIRGIRLLVTYWIITSVFMRIYFTSDIQALLLSRREIRIDYMQQLIDSNDLKVLVESDSSVERIVSKDNKELIPRLEKYKHRSVYRPEFVQKLIRHTHALIASEYIIEGIMSGYPQYLWHHSKERNHLVFGGLPIRKTLNTTLIKKLLRIYKNTFYSGIYERALTHEIYFIQYIDKLTNLKSHQQADSDIRSDQKIHFRNVLINYVLLFTGLICALFALICETIIYKYRKIK